MSYQAVPTRLSTDPTPVDADINQLQANITAIVNGAAPWSAVSSPGTPPSGKFFLYFKSDGILYKKNDANTEAVIG